MSNLPTNIEVTNYGRDSTPSTNLSVTCPDRNTTTVGPSRRSHASSLITIEEVEDALLPVYLQDSATLHAYEQEKERRGNEALVNKSRQRESANDRKWKVQDASLNAWRENKVDRRTLYGFQEVCMMTPEDLPLPSRPPTEESSPMENPELNQEKIYIHSRKKRCGSPVRSASGRPPHHTLVEYHKPISNTAAIESYGSPKYSLDETHLRPNIPKFKTVSCITMPVPRVRRRGPAYCQCNRGLNSQFCDVLGPATCNRCIENVNRRLANDLQRDGLPELDATMSGMVGPSLASLMVCGEQLVTANRLYTADKKRFLHFPTLPLHKNKPIICRAGIEKKWEERARQYHQAT